MCALPQAREKFSQCRLVGRLNGVDRICLSVLKLFSTAQASGRITSAAQITRNPCEKTLSTPKSRAEAGALAGLGALVVASTGTPAAWVSMLISRDLLQFDGLAPGDPQLDRGEDQGEDGERHAHRA